MSGAAASPSGRFGDLPPTARWALLLGLSLALGALLLWAAVPAALFLAPMVAGIAITAAGGGRLDIPAPAFALAQGLIGCMIATMLPASMAAEVAHHWLMFAAGALSVLVAAGGLGWAVARLGILPGTTVIWGLSPGASTAMIVMAEAYGADTQLVALMQYLRLVIVASVASAIARLVGVPPHHAATVAHWFGLVNWLALAETVALGALGPISARLLRVPSLALLLPLGGGVLLSRLGLLSIEMPRWLLAAAYACVGWRIGLRFTRPLLIHAARAMPRMIACTLALIAVCAVLAGLLVVGAGIDPLTAYLATSPGGADSVAIIAASTSVDAPFVMTMQTLRFLCVLFIGPVLARFVAGQMPVNSAP